MSSQARVLLGQAQQQQVQVREARHRAHLFRLAVVFGKAPHDAHTRCLPELTYAAQDRLQPELLLGGLRRCCARSVCLARCRIRSGCVVQAELRSFGLPCLRRGLPGGSPLQRQRPGIADEGQLTDAPWDLVVQTQLQLHGPTVVQIPARAPDLVADLLRVLGHVDRNSLLGVEKDLVDQGPSRVHRPPVPAQENDPDCWHPVRCTSRPVNLPVSAGHLPYRLPDGFPSAEAVVCGVLHPANQANLKEHSRWVLVLRGGRLDQTYSVVARTVKRKGNTDGGEISEGQRPLGLGPLHRRRPPARHCAVLCSTCRSAAGLTSGCLG